MQKMDTAVASVLAQGFSRRQVRLYLFHSVFYCLQDGTFHASKAALIEHVTSGEFCSREQAKQFSCAKLLLKRMYWGRKTRP